MHGGCLLRLSTDATDVAAQRLARKVTTHCSIMSSFCACSAPTLAAACRKDARYARALARLLCLGLASVGLGGECSCSEGLLVAWGSEVLADDAPSFGVLGADLGIDQPRRSDAAHLRALSSTARDAVALVARDRVVLFRAVVYAP